jgi:small subunit ribosomal protein S1
MVKAKVLDVDRREGTRLAGHQAALGRSDQVGWPGRRPEARRVTRSPAKSPKVEDGGIEVQIGGTDGDGLHAACRSGPRPCNEQRPERFAVGDKFDAMITLRWTKARKVNVSIKALEIADETEAVASIGSSDSGASLGDILQARPEEEG